jgi:sporulation protein YlmC with PRC-barrel domain
MERIENLRGSPVYSSDREKIGTVENVYYDVETNEPRWLAISGGFLSTRSTMVPLHEATFDENGAVVPFTKDQIKRAPDVAPDAISQYLERRLFEYYGFDPKAHQPVAEGRATPADMQVRYRRWEWDAPRR